MPGIHIAALADLHLGFQAYNATCQGRNAREVDVENAFARVIDAILQRHPTVQIVTIGGDVFHTLRPTTHAIMAFRDGCRRLSEAGIITVVITGNHEAAKSASTRTPNEIPADLKNVYAVTRHETLNFTIDDTRLSLRCAPHVTLQGQESPPPIESDPKSDVNVLLMHAAVRSSLRPDALPYHYAGKHAPDVTKLASGFDAVLLGDYHEFTELVPGQSVFYSGSIERTSSNIWIERAPKGLVFLNTAQPGALEFHPIPTRPMFNVNLVEQLGDTPSAEVINRHMEEALEDESVKDSIFRLFVPGFPPADRVNINRKLERALKGCALHFQLETRADPTQLDSSLSSQIRAGQTLADAAREHFQQYPPDVRKTALALLSVEGTPDDVVDTFSDHPIFQAA